MRCGKNKTKGKGTSQALNHPEPEKCWLLEEAQDTILTISPEGRWIVCGVCLFKNLFNKRMLANVPRAMMASFPRREPQELNSLGVRLITKVGEKLVQGTERLNLAYTMKGEKKSQTQYFCKSTKYCSPRQKNVSIASTEGPLRGSRCDGESATSQHQPRVL